MRTLIVQFAGDNWNDEEESEGLADGVADALDKAGIAYLDVVVPDRE